jgi:hypothetical protein
LGACAAISLSLGLATLPAIAEPLRIATYAAPLARDGPGLLLRDIVAGRDQAIAAIARVIASADPDILLLTDFDHDAGLVALNAFADLLAEQGHFYPVRYALPTNAGLPTSLDMDGNGRLGEARDAMGYGAFRGNGGMALLSRVPIDEAAVTDFSAFLWRDLPGRQTPEIGGRPFPSQEAQSIQRLASAGFWIVPMRPENAPPFSLLASAATTPAFDGPEDRNGLRNRDEIRFWSLYLDGASGPSPETFVLAAKLNADPDDGDGDHAAIRALLANPRLQDPLPASIGGALAANPGHLGDPALDTAAWPDSPQGNLRVSYVLPSANWSVEGAGVFWPATGDLLGSDGQLAGPHRLVWVDVSPQPDRP